MSAPPKVSVIVVNWNGEGVIGECLASLVEQSLSPFEVIVVDNGSTDDSLRIVHSFEGRLPLVVVPTGENLGFARANNIGIALSRGELVALLNNDAVAEGEWLRELVATMESHPGCGAVASKLLVYGEDRIDSAGDGFSTALKGFKMGEGQPSSCRAAEEEVMAACAGAALYKRECLEEAGLFDEDFFLIWEDVVLSLRIRWKGWRIFYSPRAVVYHKVRSSIGKESHTSVYYTVRNATFVRVKNIPLGIFLRCLFPYLLGEVAMLFYFCVRCGQWRAYLKAKLDAFLSLPLLLQKRRAVMEGRRCSSDRFFSLFTSAFSRGFFLAKFRKFWAPVGGEA